MIQQLENLVGHFSSLMQISNLGCKNGAIAYNKRDALLDEIMTAKRFSAELFLGASIAFFVYAISYLH